MGRALHGVARTDIFNMTSMLNEKYHIVNGWKEPARLEEIFTEMEIPAIIEKRLEKAYSIFGDRKNMQVPTVDLRDGQCRDWCFSF